MVRVDVGCDLMDEDETGHVWAFLRDARDQAVIQPGAIVVAGDEDAPASPKSAISSTSRPARWSTFASCRASSRTTRQSSSARSYRPDRFSIICSRRSVTEGEDDLPNSSQHGSSSHPQTRMRAVHTASDLGLNRWAILGSNQ
jgi:hypothetical protein